jgi:hypothetical protein
VVVALACIACDDISAPGVCTSRGCGFGNDTGLAIHLTGDLPANYLVRIREHSVAIECTEVLPCDQILFVPDITPSRVLVEVDGEGLEFEGEFVPAYSVTFPNGPGCGECRRGTITVVIP